MYPGLEHFDEARVEIAAMLGLHEDTNSFAGQCTVDEHDPAVGVTRQRAATGHHGRRDELELGPAPSCRRRLVRWMRHDYDERSNLGYLGRRRSW
jgi:hypothetical protein